MLKKLLFHYQYIYNKYIQNYRTFLGEYRKLKRRLSKNKPYHIRKSQENC